MAHMNFDITVLNLKFGQERIILEKAKEIIDDLNSLVRGASFYGIHLLILRQRQICNYWGIKASNQQ